MCWIAEAPPLLSAALPPPPCMRVQDGWSPLLSAAYHGHVDVVMPLLAAGANSEAALPVSVTQQT